MITTNKYGFKKPEDTDMADLKVFVGDNVDTMENVLKGKDEFYDTPENYGAVGDGIVDDTAAIQAVIDAGKPVRMTKDYKVTSSINVPANTHINGRGATVDASLGGFVAFRVTGSDVLIEGLEIFGSGTATNDNVSHGIGVYGTDGGAATAPNRISRVKIRECHIYNISSEGVHAEWMDYLEVTNCRIHNIGYAGVGCRSCNHARVSNNNIDEIHMDTYTWAVTNSYGVYFSQQNAADTVRYPWCFDCEANFNILSNLPWEGLDTHGGIQIRFIGNKVYNTSTGIAMVKSDDEGGLTIQGSQRCIAMGNIIEGATNVGIAHSSSTGGTNVPHRDTVIANNVLLNCALDSTSTNCGIRIQDCDNVSITGNTISDTYNSAIIVRTGTKGCTITGNTFRDIKSSTNVHTAGISIYDSNIEATMTGNSLRTSGAVTATHLNEYGIWVNTSASNVTLLAQNNNFKDATIKRILITKTQLNNAPPAHTQQGDVSIATVSGSTSASATVNMPFAFSGVDTYRVIATIGDQISGRYAVVDCNNVDGDTFTMNLRQANGQNFTGTGSSTINYIAVGW